MWSVIFVAEMVSPSQQQRPSRAELVVDGSRVIDLRFKKGVLIEVIMNRRITDLRST